MINTNNARRAIADIGSSNFDRIVKMAEIIIDQTDYDFEDYTYQPLDYVSIIKLVEGFFKDFYPEYYYRVCNILHEDIREDSFRTDLSEEYSRPQTFPRNGGLCFRIKDVKDGEFDEFFGKNGFIPSTGEIIIDRDNSIKTAFFIVHELGHKLATSNNDIDLERFFYSEIPSITLEKIFGEWLEKEGYKYEDVQALRRWRNNISYSNALHILIAKEMATCKKEEVDFDEIVNYLYMKYPSIKANAIDMDVVDEMYNTDTNIFDYEKRLFSASAYVVGRVMADYYVSDYRENKNDADIFRFIHLYGDGLLDENSTRYHYMFLNLPFENNNIQELEEYFDGDIVDVDYEEVDEDEAKK